MNATKKMSQFTRSLPTGQENQNFEHLQLELCRLSSVINLKSMYEHTVVIIPSFTIYTPHPWPECQAFEERLLFFLGLLRQAQIRILYITSNPIPTIVKDYWLKCMAPDYEPQEKRLFFYALNDTCISLSLAEKILHHPTCCNDLNKLIKNTQHCHIIPYEMTAFEQQIALKLQVPIVGCDPKYLSYGTKSNARKLFKTLNIPPPLGYENVNDKTTLIAAIKQLLIQQPDTKKIILKWDRGVAGQGNALVDLTNLTHVEPDNIYNRINQARLVNERLKRDEYFAKLTQYGGVVETYIDDPHISPSVQMQIHPDKTIDILATTEQIMGGVAAQHFMGCRFPASSQFSQLIIPKGLTIAENLAAKGVIGFLAVDFIITFQHKKIKDCYPLEINLRLGGAINPLLTLQLLTAGRYHADQNTFFTASGNPKYFIETDDLRLPKQRTMTPQQLYAMISACDLHYHEAKQAGIIVHLISALSTNGKFGLIAIGDSHQQAQAIMQKAQQLLITNN